MINYILPFYLPHPHDLVDFFVVTPLRIYTVPTIAVIIKIVFVFIFTC